MKFIYSILLIYAGCSLSCNKKNFLDERPSTDLFVPTTLKDFQSLLENDIVTRETPLLGELSSDNYYLPFSYWQNLKSKEHNAYIWAEDIFDEIGGVVDWNFPYQQVFYANVILEGLKNITVTSDNISEYNKVKGSALFLRGYAFYNLAQVFTPVYDSQDANAPHSGLPLRLSPNIDEKVGRSTNQQTYDQIIEDLTNAAGLLEDAVPMDNLNRSSRPAALALLARVHLSMRMYDDAGKYADSCLKMHGTLMDYNNTNMVNPNGVKPFERKNLETLYQSILNSSTNVLLGVAVRECIVDSTLYRSYRINDLRRTIFFTTSAQPNAKYSYYGAVNMFSGLATDEMYLIRAESYARTGKVSEAISDLNILLQNRYKTGTFTPYSTSLSEKQALDTILSERRKELPFRGLRWADIRRLNKEGANITLTRRLNGQIHTLPPNDLRYVLPIPPDVLRLSNIENNPRK